MNDDFGEMLAMMANIRMLQVPDPAAPVILVLPGGQIQVASIGSVDAAPQVRAGTRRSIASASSANRP